MCPSSFITGGEVHLAGHENPWGASAARREAVLVAFSAHAARVDAAPKDLIGAFGSMGEAS